MSDHESSPVPTHILIVGAGFGGLAAARALSRAGHKEATITLVSEKPHFEYYPALYRVVTGTSPLQVCIPISDVLHGTSVEFVVDKIATIDPSQRMLRGTSGSMYVYDELILALGSETTYLNIPGLEKFSFGFKSITEALRLKRHLHELFVACTGVRERDTKKKLLHFVVVGGGSSGVELAGELAVYAKKLAKEHGVSPDLVTIDLIEAAPRIVPMFSETVSRRLAVRLRALGVNVYTDRAVLREHLEEIAVRGMTVKTETVIWTAGVTPNRFYRTIPGAEFDKKGRVIVDEHLYMKGSENIFVIGDGASTPYSGMAQTAMREGARAAENTLRAIERKPLLRYEPKKPYYAVPVGPGWATVIIGPLTLYGFLGWMLRRAADFRYFLSILPFGKAVTAFRSGKTLCESCVVCAPEGERGA